MRTGDGTCGAPRDELQARPVAEMSPAPAGRTASMGPLRPEAEKMSPWSATIVGMTSRVGPRHVQTSAPVAGSYATRVLEAPWMSRSRPATRSASGGERRIGADSLGPAVRCLEPRGAVGNAQALPLGVEDVDVSRLGAQQPPVLLTERVFLEEENLGAQRVQLGGRGWRRRLSGTGCIAGSEDGKDQDCTQGMLQGGLPVEFSGGSRSRRWAGARDPCRWSDAG